MKQEIVYSTDPENELRTACGSFICDFTDVIPDYILQQKAADLLDIMGFSCYPDRPSDMSSATARQASFDKLRNTLKLMDQVTTRYGKHNSGPYMGQYIKQGLAVEYASEFICPEEIPSQQQHTELFFQITKGYPWWLGALWFEPTYCYARWFGGHGSLYHKWSGNGKTCQAPTGNLATWGSFAHSSSNV